MQIDKMAAIKALFTTGVLATGIKAVIAKVTAQSRLETEVMNIKQEIVAHEDRDTERHKELLALRKTDKEELLAANATTQKLITDFLITRK